MKFKTQQAEPNVEEDVKIESESESKENKGMNKELYDSFIDLIQFEYDKLSFLMSAKIYCYFNGYLEYKHFFSEMLEECKKTKDCITWYLIERMEDIPSFKVEKLDYGFSDVKKIFEDFSKKEDEYLEKLNEIGQLALEAKDLSALQYISEKIKNFKHIGCIATAAVKNEQSIEKLLCK